MTTWDSVPVRRIHPCVGALIHTIQPHGCYIAGGYARWACSRNDSTPLPGDIDIICPDDAKYRSLRNAFHASNEMTSGEDGDRAHTFQSDRIGYKIQLLKSFHGETLEDCLEQFDLSVCRVGLISFDSAIADSCFLNEEFGMSMTVRNVEKDSSARTMVRILRYVKKGYDISVPDVEKVIAEIKRTDAKVTRNKPVSYRPAVPLPVNPSYDCLDS